MNELTVAEKLAAAIMNNEKVRENRLFGGPHRRPPRCHRRGGHVAMLTLKDLVYEALGFPLPL